MENNENKDLLLDESPKEEQIEVVENQDEIKQEDFVLVQSDTKIYDKKLDTKPTTFFKDALKRFRKNKSSVVGAIILGILILLAIIVPFVSKKNVDVVSKKEAFLAPKLFNAGTGFWDGTIKRDRIVYDVVEKTPANHKINAVRDLVIDSEPTLIDQASKYGHNGYIMFENEFTTTNQSVLLYTKNVEFDPNKNYVLTIELVNEDKVQEKDLGEYEISIATIKKTIVQSNGTSIKWKRANEDDSMYRDLVKSLVEVRVGEEFIEWRYLGGEYNATSLAVADLLQDQDEEVTVEVLFDDEAELIKYRLSNEGDYHYYLEADKPTIRDINVRVNEDKEIIEWKFNNEGNSKYRQFELLSALDDGTGFKFSHYVLQPYSQETGVFTINITEKMAALGLNEKTQGHLCFSLKGKSTRQYILIKSIKVETSDNELEEGASQERIEDYEETKTFISRLTVDDPTQVVIRESTNNDYWYCTGRKGIHNSELYYCDFRYDTYLAVYDTYEATVFRDDLNDYQKKGWLKYTYNYTPLTWECYITKDQLDEFKASGTFDYSYKYSHVVKESQITKQQLDDYKAKGYLTYTFSYVDEDNYTFNIQYLNVEECPVKSIEEDTIIIDNGLLKGFRHAEFDYYESVFTYEVKDAKKCAIDIIDPETLEVDEETHKLVQVYAYFDHYQIDFSCEVLSSECPIDKIDVEPIKHYVGIDGVEGIDNYTYYDIPNVVPVSTTKKLSEVKAECRTYAAMGYKKMPRFLFGTNASGNDLFTKAFTGLRTSLILGVCTAAFCFIFGLVWGSISGYFGGNVDLIMERFCEILSGVPWIVVMTLCILHLGNNFFTFFLALCMTGWMGTAGRTRTQFYRFKGREYVLASRTLGASDARLIFRHILPNSLGTIITSSVLMIPSVIFSEATLAYLNLGLQGIQAFGVMMAENQKYLEKSPYLVVFPAVIIALMMISFNLFGNGLRDAFNPSLKGSE